VPFAVVLAFCPKPETVGRLLDPAHAPSSQESKDGAPSRLAGLIRACVHWRHSPTGDIAAHPMPFFRGGDLRGSLPVTSRSNWAKDNSTLKRQTSHDWSY